MKAKTLRLFPLAALFFVIFIATICLSTAPVENAAVTSYRVCGGDAVPGGHPTSYHPSNALNNGCTLCGGDAVPGGHPNVNGTQG